MAMSDVLFFQFIGGTIGIGMAQAIFNNFLISALPTYAPNVPVLQVLSVGAYDLQNVFSDDDLLGVLRAYMSGLHSAWILSIVGAAVAFFLPLIGSYVRLPKTPPKSWNE
jgi:hypothetical protein